MNKTRKRFFGLFFVLALLVTSLFSGAVSAIEEKVSTEKTATSMALQIEPAATMYGSGPVELIATLTAGASPVAGKTVSFDLDTYGYLPLNIDPAWQATTNSNGVATLTLPDDYFWNVGAFTFSSVFAGDEGYEGSSGFATLNVTQRILTMTMADVFVEYNVSETDASVDIVAEISGFLNRDLPDDTRDLRMTGAIDHIPYNVFFTVAGERVLQPVLIEYDLVDNKIIATLENFDVSSYAKGIYPILAEFEMRLIDLKDIASDDLPRYAPASVQADLILSHTTLSGADDRIIVQYKDNSYFDPELRLVVEESSNASDNFKDYFSLIANDRIFTGQELKALYDISLLRDNLKVQPDGALRIWIALSEEMAAIRNELMVVHFSGDASEKITPEFEQLNGKWYLIFETDSLSNFGILGSAQAQVTVPTTAARTTTIGTDAVGKTGESYSWLTTVIGTLMLMGSAIWLIARKGGSRSADNRQLNSWHLYKSNAADCIDDSFDLGT